VVCQPGTTEVAKSKDTIVCTDSTNGVDKPANIKDNDSQRSQCFAVPIHPKDLRNYKISNVPGSFRLIAYSSKIWN
jgi:hypothetical protein